jgi:hypothetical protein
MTKCDLVHSTWLAMKRDLWIALAVGAPICSFISPSEASPVFVVTDATFVGSILVGGTPPPGNSCCTSTTTTSNTVGTISNSYTNYAGSVATSSLTVDGAAPTITANVSAGGATGVSEANALETLTYTGHLSGPAGFAPIDFISSGSVISNANPGNGSSSSTVSLSIAGGQYFASAQSIDGATTLHSQTGALGSGTIAAGTGAGSFVMNGSVEVFSGNDFQIVMTVELNTQMTGAPTGMASTSFDPFFFIDPIFAEANPGYSLSFSPQIGNAAPAVPEPSTWAMMLIGFAGLGFAGYNRARQRTIAA